MKLKTDNNIILIPNVECGLFGIQDDFYEEYLSLDEHFIKDKKSTFFFRASGNSMQPLILEKDVLVVDRSRQPKSGQVCVVSLDGQLICKRFMKIPNGVLLKSDNQVYKPIIVTAEMEMSVWGVVVAIARDMREQ
tara:strand:- start:29020 stop:29424 length:405 start_codon:yes stop_codon:yes gene_type:complete